MPEYWLFSYGTLREPKVQLGTFGRLLQGQPDELLGYALRRLQIMDDNVAALSGTSDHPIVTRTGSDKDLAAGTVFSVTAADLEKADANEVADYRRVTVSPASGKSAFLYVAASSP